MSRSRANLFALLLSAFINSCSDGSESVLQSGLSERGKVIEQSLGASDHVFPLLAGDPGSWNVASEIEAPGSNCSQGGIKVTIFLDGQVEDASMKADGLVRYLCDLQVETGPSSQFSESELCLEPHDVADGVQYTCDDVSQTGTLKPKESCSSEGETKCITSADFPAVDKETVASKTLLGQRVLGLSGTYVIDFPESANVLESDTVGSVSGEIPSCTQAGQIGCLATMDFPAIELSTLAPKVIQGQTVAGIAGSFVPDYPELSNVRSSDTVNGIGGTLFDCNSDGALGCVTVSDFPSVNGTALELKLLNLEDAGGVSGVVRLPLPAHVFSSTSYGALNSITGALTLPNEQSVISGEAFGPDSSLLGSYVPDFPNLTNLRANDTSNGSIGLIPDCSVHGEIICFVSTGFNAQPDVPHILTELKNLGIKLWLDAADASSFDESGGSVSQWRDKSGNGLHLSNAVSATKPSRVAAGLNGLNTVNFGIGDLLDAASATDWNFLHSRDGQGGSLFLIGRFNEGLGSGNVQQTILVTNGNSGSNRGLFLAWEDLPSYGQRSFRMYLTTASSINVHYSGDPDQVPSNSFLIAGFNFLSDRVTSANRASIFIDGLKSSSSNASSSTPNAGNAFMPLRIGDVSSGGSMSIAEYLVFERVLSTSERNLVEGYLAHKWGLQSRLPSGHPHKVSPPEVIFP